jgi:anti-sigma regulatory factor (Ser/Thr protein kinase)
MQARMDGAGLPISFQVAGGPEAPRAARLAVSSALAGQIGAAVAGDVELIVSELVTNSVRHAGVGRDEAVVVIVLLDGRRLRLEVVDGGADSEPHIAARTPDEPGGFGLRLVERLAADWGVTHDGDGLTRVWCEVPVNPGLKAS